MDKIIGHIAKVFNFLSGFISRGGMYVLSSSIIVKLFSLIISVFIVRLLSKEEFGAISYVLLIISIILPFTSGAIARTVLRFGAKMKNVTDSDNLFHQAYKKGLLLNFIIIILLIISSDYLFSNYKLSSVYFIPLFCLIVFEYIFSMRQTRLRIHGNNKSYAMMAFYRVIALFIGIILFTSVLDSNADAYMISLLLAPMLAILVSTKQVKLDKLYLSVKSKGISTEIKRFWIFVVASGGISQLQLSIDSILVAALLKDPSEFANYRISSILPLSFLIIPTAFFNSEYVELTKNHTDRLYVNSYLKNYLSLGIVFSFILILITQFFGHEIIVLLFGEKYVQSVEPFQILTIGICGSLLFRQPFGILNNVSGRPDLNLINGVFSICITVVLLFWLIPNYGLLGAALGTAIMLWFSGLISMYLYYSQIYSKYSEVNLGK
jgi:O-antigen/teichoic acid export membrane protein